MTPPPTLLLVDDDDPFRSVMADELRYRGLQVKTASNGEEAIEYLKVDQPDLILLDLQLPDMSGIDVLEAAKKESPGSEVIILTGHGSMETAIQAIRRGAFDYVQKPTPFDELEVRLSRALERQALSRRTGVLERGLTPRDPGDWLVGGSREFRELVDLAKRVGASDSTVLITGETGSGKEMIAKLLHSRSSRAGRPFVVVECAALQEELLQSELFGHERGSFTGADRRKVGLFEVAHGGTLFLDEVGEISPPTQVKLLRVLDTGTFRRVGGTSQIKVDVRVIAATNRNLESRVSQDLFREDLFYRLSTIILHLPPLRDRKGDVELLTHHFAGLLNDRFGLGKTFSPEALELIQFHDWPGNVRELLHVVERALVVCEGGVIGPEHLPDSLRSPNKGRIGSPGGASDPLTREGPLPSLAEVEQVHIERVLRSVKGHRSRAARILGISERSLYRKLRALEEQSSFLVDEKSGARTG